MIQAARRYISAERLCSPLCERMYAYAPKPPPSSLASLYPSDSSTEGSKPSDEERSGEQYPHLGQISIILSSGSSPMKRGLPLMSMPIVEYEPTPVVILSFPHTEQRTLCWIIVVMKTPLK